MYEWESALRGSAIKSRIANLRSEIKRVSNVTLRGSFTKEEDRKYWELKLAKMNSELSALEQMH